MGRKATFYLFDKLLLIFTISTLVASFLCHYAPQAPLTFVWIVVGIAAPVVFGLNLLLFIWWLVRRRWFVALISLAAMFVGSRDLATMIQPPRMGDIEQGELRVATCNVHGFKQESSRDYSAHLISKVMEQEQVDVVCLQEVLEEKRFPFDSLALHFTDQLPHYVREISMACFSRYPIVAHKYYSFPKTNQSFMSVDVKIGERTVRFISAHLQTTGLTTADYLFRKAHGVGIPFDSLCDHITYNAHFRLQQVAEMRKVIAQSPMPLVVAGDFNDTPLSHTYHQLTSDLTDPFRTAGAGFAGTFHGLLRIDYILHNKGFEAVDYYVWRNSVVSDHSPVIASLRFTR